MNNPTLPSPSATSSPHMLYKASWQDGTRSSTQTPKASQKPLGPTPTPCSRLAVLKPDRPRLWWLMPWAHARTWHKALWALKDYADRVDRALDLQTKVIEDQSKEIQTLRRQLADSNRSHDAKNATIHGLTEERDELLDRGDEVVVQYRKLWVRDNGPTTPLSVLMWESAKERHSR